MWVEQLETKSWNAVELFLSKRMISRKPTGNFRIRMIECINTHEPHQQIVHVMVHHSRAHQARTHEPRLGIRVLVITVGKEDFVLQEGIQGFQSFRF